MKAFTILASLAFLWTPLLALGDSTAFLGRGANVRAEASDADFAALAATGATLVRIYFANRPLRDMEPPYAFNQQNFALLDHDLDLCQKLGLRVIIDPHTFPGEEFSRFTTAGTDSIWFDPKFAAMAAQLWTEIAQRGSQRGSVIAGYDLLNEPALPNMGKSGSMADYNALVSRLISAIRAVDTTHPIIIESPMLFTGLKQFTSKSNQTFQSYLAAPPRHQGNEPALIYSLHMYEPSQFSYQGSGDKPMGLPYPGVVNGQTWNARKMAEYFAPVVEFQKRYNVQIYLGEFSTVRWVRGDGDHWLKDVLEFAEAHRWSWTYHEWRGADMWDPEKTSDRDDRKRYPSTPRLDLLKSYWRLGSQ